MLAYYFKIDPETLSDEEYALKYAQMKWALKDEAKRWSNK